MLWFMYFGGYPCCEDVGKDGILSGPHLSIHVKVHALATKYGLTALASLADKHTITAAKFYLKKGLFQECIPLIYGSSIEPSKSMRSLVTSRLRLRMSKMINDKLRWTAYQENLQRYPVFAYDVFMALSTMYPQPTKTQYRDISVSTPPDSTKEACVTRLDSSRSTLPTWMSRRKNYLGNFIYSDLDGTLYNAALLAIRPRARSNEFCRLQVVYSIDRQFGFHRWGGDVGTPGKFNKFEGPLSRRNSIHAAIDEFKRTFRLLTGLDWERRFEQPVKSEYTFIGDKWVGFADVKAEPL